MYLFIRFTLYHTEKPILTLVPSGETQQENKNTLLFRLGSEPTIVTYNTKKIILCFLVPNKKKYFIKIQQNYIPYY